VVEYEILPEDALDGPLPPPDHAYVVENNRLILLANRLKQFCGIQHKIAFDTTNTQAAPTTAWSSSVNFLLLLAGENHTLWNRKMDRFAASDSELDLALTTLIV
jgi:hypothetical protein